MIGKEVISDVDPCSVLGTCDSNHVCHSYANLTYSCDCPTGKTGPDCQDGLCIEL